MSGESPVFNDEWAREILREFGARAEWIVGGCMEVIESIHPFHIQEQAWVASGSAVSISDLVTIWILLVVGMVCTSYIAKEGVSGR